MVSFPSLSHRRGGATSTTNCYRGAVVERPLPRALKLGETYSKRGKVLTMANKISAFFSRKTKEGTKAARTLGAEIESEVGEAIDEVKSDVKKAVKGAQKSAKDTAKTAKATTKSAVKAVKASANDTAKNVTEAARAAKSAGEAIVADVKNDINLATQPNSTWTVAELKEAARKKKIAGYSSMTKPQLLKALGAK